MSRVAGLQDFREPFGDLDLAAFISAASYIVWTDGTNYYAKNGQTGEVEFSGADAATVMQAALNGLTAGRTWEEKVLLKGNFILTSTITLDSYTILELNGKITLGSGADCTILQAINKTSIRILGGEWDGNRVNQAADSFGFDFQNCTNLLVRDVNVHDIKHNGTAGSGIRFYICNIINVERSLVYNCVDITQPTGGIGIFLISSNEFKITDSTVHDCHGGIYAYTPNDGAAQTIEGNHISRNLVYNNYRDGIALYPDGVEDFTSHNVIDSNILWDNSQNTLNSNIKVGDSGLCSYNTISNNVIYETGLGNYGRGIVLHTNTLSNNIENNIIENTYYVGIKIQGNLNNVVGNSISITREAGSHGIEINGGDQNQIDGNLINNIANSGVALTNADYNKITNNYIDTCSHSCIRIYSGSNNKVYPNILRNPSVVYITDVGTNTIYNSKIFQFTEAINGAIVTTSPTGVNVDAATEAALLWGQLPAEVQQVVRIKVWAVSEGTPIGAGGQMHLAATFNAGASNAAYNTATKSWVLANFDGEEADYVANDVVSWVIVEATTGNELKNLRAGDSFEFFAQYNAGADPDGATDAVFRCIEVEYV